MLEVRQTGFCDLRMVGRDVRSLIRVASTTHRSPCQGEGPASKYPGRHGTAVPGPEVELERSSAPPYSLSFWVTECIMPAFPANLFPEDLGPLAPGCGETNAALPNRSRRLPVTAVGRQRSTPCTRPASQLVQGAILHALTTNPSHSGSTGASAIPHPTSGP